MRRFLLLALGLSLGCKPENNITAIPLEDIAVTTGDFDRIEESLNRQLIPHTLYEGYIYRSVYDPEEDGGGNGLKAETLLTAVQDDGEPELMNFQAAFVNSGTRGLGSLVYNADEPDDSILGDTKTVPHIRQFVETQGRTLVVSDWAYDLVELAWPDKIDFMNEASGYDAAQMGTSDSVIARVTDPELAELLDNESVAITFDFSYWSVMEGVGNGVDVYMRGDLEFRLPDGGYGTVEDVPLLVGFDAGAGRVIMSSFSWAAQSQGVTDTTLLYLVQGLEGVQGTGEEAEGG